MAACANVLLSSLHAKECPQAPYLLWESEARYSARKQCVLRLQDPFKCWSEILFSLEGTFLSFRFRNLDLISMQKAPQDSSAL
jgi:hypothetical protein